jgi:branched-chain amino acid transport system substrate-binding protein
MKKISLLLAFFIFSCHLPQKIAPGTSKPVELVKEEETHEQFESRPIANLVRDHKKTQIALFLPFSGKNKDLGWSLYNAATLSLFDNDLGRNIELVLIDSKDTPEDAKKAFGDIVNRKIKVVIGPIFSNVIEAIEKDAKKNNITVISLSNNQDLLGKTNSDGGVFLAGMLPEPQIDKIVGYALEHGKYSFATIAPNNQYGKTITDLMKKITRNRDGNFITAEFYSSDKDIDRAVENVMNSFSLSARLNEGKKVKKDTVITEADKIYPQVIMIPEGGKSLFKIVSAMQRLNKDERAFQLIGTNQWDDIATINDFHMMGAWFVAPENDKFRDFERSYYRSFNKFPPRIASIVYDLTAASAQIAALKGNKEITISDFTNFENPPKNGFEGIDGLFRFLPNGIVQRNLAVLQVASGKFEAAQKPIEVFLKY